MFWGGYGGVLTCASSEPKPEPQPEPEPEPEPGPYLGALEEICGSRLLLPCLRS